MRSAAGPLKSAVRREREDAPRAERAQLVRGRGQRARRVDHVVDDDAVAALHRADEVHRADDARRPPAASG